MRKPRLTERKCLVQSHSETWERSPCPTVHVLSHICLQGPQPSSLMTEPFPALPSPLSSLRREALPGQVKSRSASRSATGTTQGRSVLLPHPHTPRCPQPGPAGTRALWIPAAAAGLQKSVAAIVLTRLLFARVGNSGPPQASRHTGHLPAFLCSRPFSGSRACGESSLLEPPLHDLPCRQLPAPLQAVPHLTSGPLLRQFPLPEVHFSAPVWLTPFYH